MQQAHTKGIVQIRRDHRKCQLDADMLSTTFKRAVLGLCGGRRLPRIHRGSPTASTRTNAWYRAAAPRSRSLANNIMRHRAGTAHGTLQQVSRHAQHVYFEGAQEGIQIGLQLVGAYAGPFLDRFELV